MWARALIPGLRMGLYLVTGSVQKKFSCNEVIKVALSHVTGVLIKGGT